MSAIIPGCDSDEEVFWGPVTARELEIIWRSRMANKKGESANPVEKFIKKELNKSSGQNVCCMNSNGSVQEVPSLQDLRNSSGNQISFEENDQEHHLEHMSVGSESTLPLHEACMEINKDHNKIQNVINLPGDNSNNYNQQYEDEVRCEPESSNQLDHSIENPELAQSIELVHSKDTREERNTGVDNMNEISQETTELHQPDDIYKDSNVESEACCYSTGEEIENSDLSSRNFNTSNSNDRSNHVIDCLQPKTVISAPQNVESVNLGSSEFQSEPSSSKIDASLNCSNIENIPPENLNYNSTEQKEALNDLDVAENIGPFKKTNACDHKLNGDNVLQELRVENQDVSVNSSHVDDAGASESSDEKSFVSLISEEENCISSTNSQYSSSNQDNTEHRIVKNKENEEPLSVASKQDCIKSKIPVSNHIKATVLKPARLHHTSDTVNDKWLSDLKRKKIPKPKKPDYMVSPAKLGSILKNRNLPASADKLPDGKRSAHSNIASCTPQSTPGSSKILLTPRKKQFEYIKSPISEYIRTGSGIPTAKSLPALQSPNKIPVPITAKQTPVQKLPLKFYSSAEKLVIKSGPSSVLKPAENRLFITPKIFKHQGRVADLKKPGDINVVTPRAVRKTNLTETSFACLPQSSKELEVSVLEEL